MTCDQELCEHWTGDGCACAVFSIERATTATIDETRIGGEDGKHECPYGPCERRVSMNLFACRAHWMKVPAHLRAALYAAFDGGSPAEYLEIRAECVEAMNLR